MIIRTANGTEFESIDSQSILDSAIDAGVVLPYSCKNGRCGICRCAVKGQVRELRPQVSLTEQQRTSGEILTCCTAAEGDLSLGAEDLPFLAGLSTVVGPAKIDSIEVLGEGYVELYLRTPPSFVLNFAPGQYLDLRAEGTIVRSYSIASMPGDARIRLLVRAVEGGQMTEYLFQRAKLNDLLQVEGPKGTFAVRGKGTRIVFLATGTGIAPVLSMVRSILSERPEAAGDLLVLWGNRSSAEFVLDLDQELPGVEVLKVESRDQDGSPNQSGYVQEVLCERMSDFSDCEVYACGSPAMVESAQQLLLSKGLPESRFFADPFVENGT